MNNELNTNVTAIPLASITADADVFGLYLPKKSKVVGAWLSNGASTSASDTDFCTVALKNGSDTVAEIDTRAAHENGLTANVPKAMNLVAAEQIIDAGSHLKVTYDESGTFAMTTAVVYVEWFPL